MAPSSRPETAWLGLDLGTSSVKALLVDEGGHTLAIAREPLGLLTPEPLAAEQEAGAWWEAAARAVRSCVEQRPGSRIEAVGLTGQKHALLPLDDGGEPLTRAVLWADGRAVAETAEAERRVPHLARRTGAPALPGYLVPKWLRLLAREPEVVYRTRHLCFAKDWIRRCLTGTYATDRTEASASQLWDAQRHAWSADLCEAFGVPLEVLPAVHASADEAGRVSEAGARATGLAAGTPLVAGAGDNEAAALACGALEPGTVAVVLGTSGTVVAPAERQGEGEGLVWGHGVLREGALATGVVLSAGRALAWIRAAAFPPGTRMADLVEAAASVGRDADLPVFLPTLVGERSPVPDPEASGVFAGLRPHHRKEHLAASVLDGVAASLGEVVESLRRAGIDVQAVRLTSGGAASPVVGRLVAAAARAPTSSVGEDEGPARGAALLAFRRGAADAGLVEAAHRWVRPRSIEPPGDAETERMNGVRARIEHLRAAMRPPRR